MPGQELSPARLLTQGAQHSLPLVLAAVPFGILYGVLAKAAGMSDLAIMGMSALVFAGSAQFIAVSMLGAAAAWPAILLATFFVNLRHMLYAATLVPHTRHMRSTIRAKLAFWLTDETFAVVSGWLRNNKEGKGLYWYYTGSALLMYSNWLLCSWIGLTLGQNLPGMTDLGLEVAMIVAFVGIIAPAMISRPMWTAGVTAGLCAIFTLDWPYQSGLIVSSIIGVVLGLILEKLETGRRSSSHE